MKHRIETTLAVVLLGVSVWYVWCGMWPAATDRKLVAAVAYFVALTALDDWMRRV